MINKYYTHYTCSGVNKCIKIKGCSVLPNCVGYAWGRAYEVNKEEPKLSLGHAKDWYGYKDGYPRGSVPKVGAIGCFEGGKYGHVVYVEKVYQNGDILISESNYGVSGNGVRKRKLKKSNGYAPYQGYKLQGFIYVKENKRVDVKFTHSNGKNYYCNVDVSCIDKIFSSKAEFPFLCEFNKLTRFYYKFNNGKLSVVGGHFVDGEKIACNVVKRY